MIIRCISREYCVLPALLLSAAKEQMRVEFDRDDEFIRTALTRAISEIEAVTNLDIFETVYFWDTTYCWRHNDSFEIPHVPVLELAACDDKDCTTARDITDAVIYRDSAHTPNQTFLKREHFGLLRLVTGYRQVRCMPPALISAILMQTAHLYENREMVQQGNYQFLPDTTQRLLAGLWRPSV